MLRNVFFHREVEEVQQRRRMRCGLVAKRGSHDLQIASLHTLPQNQMDRFTLIALKHGCSRFVNACMFAFLLDWSQSTSCMANALRVDWAERGASNGDNMIQMSTGMSTGSARKLLHVDWGVQLS